MGALITTKGRGVRSPLPANLTPTTNQPTNMAQPTTPPTNRRPYLLHGDIVHMRRTGRFAHGEFYRVHFLRGGREQGYDDHGFYGYRQRFSVERDEHYWSHDEEFFIYEDVMEGRRG